MGKSKPRPKPKPKPEPVPAPAPAVITEPVAQAAPEVRTVSLEGCTIPEPSGWAKLKAAGKHAIMLSVTSAEYARLRAAAQADRRSLAGWILVTALKAAPEVNNEQ